MPPRTLPPTDPALAKIVDAINKSETFFLSGHVRPDGDALGSALAMASGLLRLGKKPQVYSRDPVPESLRLLPGWENIKVGLKAEGRFDCAMFFECSTPERAGGLIDLDRQAEVVINVDSHKTHSAYGDINLIDPDASSTAEQVHGILKALGLSLEPAEGICLYVGLATDTGRFQYSNTTPAALRLAADLLESGISLSTINDRLFATKPLNALKLLSLALGTLELKLGGKVGVQMLSREAFRAAEAGPEHAEEIVNYGLTPPGVEAAVLLKEDKQILVSLRSRGKVDVSVVAEAFGGGGHRNAAGCRLDGDLKEAASRILKEIAAQL